MDALKIFIARMGELRIALDKFEDYHGDDPFRMNSFTRARHEMLRNTLAFNELLAISYGYQEKLMKLQ